MSNLLKRRNVIKVREYLHNFDDNIELIILEETARTANDAAKSLKKEVGAIVKSLLFKNIQTNKYILCLVSGDQYISIKKLSKIIGSNIIKANAFECKKITGFSIGGISPVAHLYPPSRIIIDENLNKFEMLYAAAGHPYVVFSITYRSLCSIVNGEIFSIVE
jgi:prolyl-tRNA editing enzyme YbaK/EbsC (Cys-tRNA(Pro) deacylase)